MIYTRDKSEVTTLGEVQKFKVSIDQRNINHIVTILSSNLYSHPTTSFLRETVSNAVDSHVEAGSKEPIIITRTNTDIAVRDFGTGISPDRFEEIYLNIGSSTKRQSNDYIGSFGIGRFSALAVADIANITSFYNGKAYYYVMNMDVDQLHIDLLYEKDTDEPNGVEVKVPLKSFNPDNLECLAFIDNVYVETEVEDERYKVNKFNERTIHSYKNFKIPQLYLGNLGKYTQILLGKIPYKVDWETLWDYGDSDHKVWKKTFQQVYPQLNIGDLDITPNREELLYSRRTIEALRKAYDACIEELTQLWNTQCTKEYEDITEYMFRIDNHTDNYLEVGDIHIAMPITLVYDAIYKKRPKWNAIDAKTKKTIISHLLCREVEVLGLFDRGTLGNGRKDREVRWLTLKRLLQNWVKKDYRDVIALPSRTGFSSIYFKDFLFERYPSQKLLMLKKFSKVHLSTVRRIINMDFGISYYDDATKRMFIVELFNELLHYLADNIPYKDIINSPEYIQYKKDNAVQRNRKSIPTEKIRFTVSYCQKRETWKTTKTVGKIVNYIKSQGRDYREARIVYSDLENPFLLAFVEMKYPKLVIISVAKGKMKLLKEHLPEWIRPIEELYSPDNKTLQKYAAMKYITSQPQTDLSFDAKYYFPVPVQQATSYLAKENNLYAYSRKYNSLCDPTSVIDIVPKEKYDQELMSRWNTAKPYLEMSYKLKNSSVMAGNNMSVCFFLLMKNRKIPRLNYGFYKSMKETVKELLDI